MVGGKVVDEDSESAVDEADKCEGGGMREVACLGWQVSVNDVFGGGFCDGGTTKCGIGDQVGVHK